MITPVDYTLNNVRALSESDSFIDRHIRSREETLICIPLELFTLALRPLHILFSTSGTVFKAVVKLTRFIAPESEKLQQLDQSLPNLRDLLGSIKKTILIAAGFFTSFFVGVFHPLTNFNIHLKLGIITDRKPKLKKKEPIQEPVAILPNSLPSASSEVEKKITPSPIIIVDNPPPKKKIIIEEDKEKSAISEKKDENVEKQEHKNTSSEQKNRRKKRRKSKAHKTKCVRRSKSEAASLAAQLYDEKGSETKEVLKSGESSTSKPLKTAKESKKEVKAPEQPSQSNRRSSKKAKLLGLFQQEEIKK